MNSLQQIIENISPDSLKSLSSSEQQELLTYLEQEYRLKCQSDYLTFIKSIDIPGVPYNPDDPDCEQFYPDKIKPARHHHLIIQALQHVYDGTIRRLMIFAPPGSAKSTYTTVAFPPFFMGKGRKNIICTSYGADLAKKFGRKCRSIVKAPSYYDITQSCLSAESSAADMWTLTNGSEYMSGGILSGITGNRAHGLLIDDPTKGRDEADSAVIQKRTWEAYNDDLVTRLIPGGWQIIIQTRWNELDLAGHLLPPEYDGKTGWVKCTDGHDWYVICLPMECERHDDPLGRKPGEMLWSDWYIKDDVLAIKNGKSSQRTWSALYQQRPAPEDGDYFKREWFKTYNPLSVDIKRMRIYGASDYAVTKDGGDYTVHVVVGVNEFDDIYVLDLWRGQTESNVWIDAFLDLVKQWQPLTWAEEQGQIIKSIGPFINQIMQERRIYCYRKQFTSANDKQSRARSIQARASMGKVYLPERSPWVSDLMAELLKFDNGKNDDQVDALSLIGRMMDTMQAGDKPKEKEKPIDVSLPSIHDMLQSHLRERMLGRE